MCDKRPYPGLKSAKRALRSTRRRRQSHRKECRVYWCKHCKAYHLTSHDLEQLPPLAPKGRRQHDNQGRRAEDWKGDS